MSEAGFLFRTVLLSTIFLPAAVTFGDPPSIDPNLPFEERLGAYRFFAVGDPNTPNQGVIPYELNTPHFADYSRLDRYLYIPSGERIRHEAGSPLRFPEGSVLLLNVGTPSIEGSSSPVDKVLETRLLVKSSSGWRAAIYVWDEAVGDAILSLVGAEVPLDLPLPDGAVLSRVHHVPNVNQCKMCHEIDGAMAPLGPVDPRNLNRVREGADPPENQVEMWMRSGLLTGLSEDLETIGAFPVWDDPTTGTVDARARAYLEMNCSSCHRPGGLADTSGLDLTFDQADPIKFGVFKAPVAAGRGVGKARFGIVPGRPGDSILFHRMASTDPGVRMPVVGRSLVHEEGLALIREWIEAMEYPELTAAQTEREALREERLRFLRGLAEPLAAVKD